MSSTSRAWVVAASMGAVEALKDQGFCRWNHAFRSLQQHAKSNLGGISQAKRFTSSTVEGLRDVEGRGRESEESLRKVMYLSCWGPN